MKKRPQKTSKLENLELSTKRIESKVLKHLHLQLSHLSKKLPAIHNIMSTKISVLNYYFNLNNGERCDENVSLYGQGIINSHVCINAATTISHTELDFRYTLISVPKQPYVKYKSMKAEFYFNVNRSQTFVIPMQEYTCLVYSGYLICHHQQLSGAEKKI